MSLALYKKERAVGIIFSGTGTDGQDGVRDIKENGGMVMAQDSSAQVTASNGSILIFYSLMVCQEVQ